MDIKRLMKDYYFLIIELKEYEKSKHKLVMEYKEIQKYISVSDTVVIHMKELYCFYTERCEYLTGQIKRAENLLKSLDEPYYTIMYKRYREGKKLEIVADETYYSYKTVIAKIKKSFEILGGVEDDRNRKNSKKNRSVAG